MYVETYETSSKWTLFPKMRFIVMFAFDFLSITRKYMELLNRTKNWNNTKSRIQNEIGIKDKQNK